MRAAYWTCVKFGCAAIVTIPPASIALYRQYHPLPAECRVDCHWVVPPLEWDRGGFFAPGGPGYIPPWSPVAVPPPPGWSRDWGSNTAPWPAFQPPAAFGSPPVEIVTEEEDKDSPEKCYRLKHAHCRHHVDTPEPSSVLGFLTALVLLAGALRTRIRG